MAAHNDLRLFIEGIACLKTVKEKVQALKNAVAHIPTIRGFLTAVLDPSICYFLSFKRIKGIADRPKICQRDLNDLFDVLHKLATRFRGDLAMLTAANFLANADEDLQALFKMCLDRQLPGKIGVTIADTAFPGLIYQQPYGGVSAYDPDKIESRFAWADGVMLQEKADGLSLFIAKRDCPSVAGYDIRTRQGQDVTNAMSPLLLQLYPHIPSGMVLHVEACLMRAGKLVPRVEANGIYNSVFQGEPLPFPLQVHLKLIDIIRYEGFYRGVDSTPCRVRYNLLDQVSKNFKSGEPDIGLSVLPVLSTIVTSASEAREQVRQWIALRKWEGGVLKDPEAPWENKRMQSQMKLKNEFECSLIVVGHKPHSKNPTWVGSLLVESAWQADMIRTYVGSGLNEDASTMLDRRAGIDAFLGRVVDVKAECVSKNFALQLPRITGVRIDKTVPDTFNQVLDAYNDSISIKE